MGPTPWPTPSTTASSPPAVEQVVTTERPILLERLAQRLSDVVLCDPRALAVTVSVRKLRPPVPQVLGTSGVRITRER